MGGAEQEIDAAVDKTREAVGGMRQGEDVVVLPLYSSLPHHLQIKAIAPAGRHVRRKVRAPFCDLIPKGCVVFFCITCGIAVSPPNEADVCEYAVWLYR